MHANEFYRPISADRVPSGKTCEWCGKPAEQQLTAIGGSHHNESGAFCHSCGEQFSQVVIHASAVAQTPNIKTKIKNAVG